jgi:hypothetical protein
MKMANVRMTMWLMVMVSVVFGLGLPEAQATVVFNDGGTHTVDWAIYDYVWVRNSTLSQPTTLNLATGGFISQCLDIYDSSRANVSGGSIHHSLDAYDSSQVNISGGSFGGSLIADFSSQVRISGVSIDESLFAYKNSQVSISGGSIHHSLIAYEYSQVSISGGSISEDLLASGNNQVSISGGSIGGGLNVYAFSQANISGGSIGGGLYALNSSQITIYGSGFNYPYGTLTGRGLLTGTLASGEIINNAFYVYSNARIVLVPEPSTLSILALGGLVLCRFRCSRSSYCISSSPSTGAKSFCCTFLSGVVHR